VAAPHQSEAAAAAAAAAREVIAADHHHRAVPAHRVAQAAQVAQVHHVQAAVVPREGDNSSALSVYRIHQDPFNALAIPF
jgi:hypothetical protein